MENSTLNKAHLAARKASKLAKKGLYADAAACHVEAAKCFQELESKISSESAPIVRSLEEQSKYHLRQAEIIKKISEIAEKQRSGVMESKMKGTSSSDKLSPRAVMDSELQRNFEQFDSLIQILNTDRKDPKPVVEYTIRPKCDADVIEELQTVNKNLRLLVAKLMEEVKLEREEKRVLEKRLELYEPKFVTPASKLMDLMDQAPPAVPELSPLEPPDCNY